MPEIEFKDWVFQQLVAYGAIRDYEKSPHEGKGRSPKGNFSIQQAKITQLRDSGDSNKTLWGLVGYAGLVANGDIGKRLKPKVLEFCQKMNPDNPQMLFDVIQRAANCAQSEFKVRYKENP